MIKRIVILGASITALAVARVAARSGLNVIVAHVQEGIAMRSRFAEKLILPDWNPDVVIERLSAAMKGVPTLCIADSDDWLRFIVEHRKALEAVFTDVLHPSREALEICLDKSRFLSWCKEQGINAPEGYTAGERNEIEPAPAFPLLIRPKVTQHGKGTGLPKALEVKNLKELHCWIRRFRDRNVEPSISESLLRPDVRQYSVGFARRRDGVMWMTVAEKLRSLPEQCAGGTYVVSSLQPDVEALARRAVEALDYYGIGEAEVMFDVHTGKCYLIEINARPWVQYALAERTRPGMFKFMVSEDTQRPEQLGAPNLSARWLYFISDVFVCFSRSDGIVRHDRCGFFSYLLSIAKANEFAVYDFRDPDPFFYDINHWVRTLRAAYNEVPEKMGKPALLTSKCR